MKFSLKQALEETQFENNSYPCFTRDVTNTSLLHRLRHRDVLQTQESGSWVTLPAVCISPFDDHRCVGLFAFHALLQTTEKNEDIFRSVTSLILCVYVYCLFKCQILFIALTHNMTWWATFGTRAMSLTHRLLAIRCRKTLHHLMTS